MGLDLKAIEAIKQYKFKPAMKDGKTPVPVMVTNEAPHIPEISHEIYKVGGRISAPVLIHRVTAHFTDEAREAKYQGVCLIGLTVDTQGKPQNVRVVRALGMGLDEKALEAVRQYKFKPSLMDHKTPVPVMITIEIDFRLY